MKPNPAHTARALLAAAILFTGGVGAQTVVNGQASFQQLGSVRTVTNTPGTIIEWPAFSIAAGEATRFVQQSAASAVLNRITGQDPSVILGALQSNGRVFLINPNGILFGAGAQVNVNGLVASTLALSNADFLSGKMNFSAGAVAGRVANQGSIGTPEGGQVLLIGPQVENSGLIHAPGGDVMLAAGRSVKLADSGSPALHVVVSAPQDQAINLGQIVAQSGRVGIYGNLVSQRGLVSADRAAVGAAGQIVFKANGDLLLEAGSLTSASGAGVGTGGTIHLLGERVALTGNARVDASGETGGGTVLVGGDYRGQNPDILNAKQVYMAGDAFISADALSAGNGGKVIAWSDGTTRVYGSISARGGAQSGDGGFVETSGHVLDMQGRVDTRAANGRVGTLLLDPTNIFIATNQASATEAGMVGGDTSADADTFVAVGAVGDSLLTVATLQAALANTQVVVTTDNAAGTGAGNIQVVDAVSWTSDTSLTLNATADIKLNATITGGAGSRLALNSATGNINQTAAITVVALSATASAGSVNLTNPGNQVQRVAGFANGAGGFNFRNNGTPLTIGVAGPQTGITSGGSGPINVNVAGSLTLLSPVTSRSGDIVLAGNTLDNQSTVSSTSGGVTVQGVVLRPSLASCIASPSTSGCSAVLPTLSQCINAPTTAGCSVVLPSLATCVAAPVTAGCVSVLPTFTQCIGTPTLAGCAAVLPSLAQCSANPALQGCNVVLPSLAQCSANPTLQGCGAVLPTLAQCTASPGLQGCSAVLPTLAKCAAAPATQGCSIVLPFTAGTNSSLTIALNSTVDLINTSVTGNTSSAAKPGDAKAVDKTNVAGSDSGTKSDVAKKTYCN
ncbi:filamentous hemagglutinin N-terminal domain-containing protein [Polaromonas sp.]|uniref:two-partner secretion domain-containing protein n=1 Tax=Polaromonas sp. TaxID=1869339 RepID=UPI002487D94C|nr:filamentous hemagglutinin N-terminal domain-containing protein [Polaromonas sp.]MDI1273618.1 filamentous hemagglutinin N-terminal domain-containing protein [Polaromonas sp.]